MIVMGIDSAGKTAGVALMKDDALLYESCLATGLTHSETLLRLCDSALTATNLTLNDVDLFAVAGGPGSFTGLRIGLSLVKGFALPSAKPCISVSTLEALAYSLSADGNVLCALDARRNEVYYAAFTIKNGIVTRICNDGNAPVKDLAPLLESLPGRISLIGDGAHLISTHFCDNENLYLCPPHLRLLRAGGVCRNALANGIKIPAASLQPNYHRLSQAERERLAK